MKASELRIGNYIYDDDNIISKVNGFKPFGKSVRCDEEEGCVITIDLYNHGGISKVWGCDSNYIKPIILTEEILLNCGFEKSHLGIFKNVFLMTENKISNDFTVYLGNNIAVIKYLHQLQNLYFALTGEELNIKL